MLVEGLRAATLTNGVLRIDALYRNAVGEDVTSGELLIPAHRLTAMIAELQEIGDQIAETRKTETPVQTH